MLLVGFSWLEVLLGVLYVSVTILLLIVFYRRVLAKLGKNRVPAENYCTLYSLDSERVFGEVEFYFTAENTKHYALSILNNEMSEFYEVASGDCHEGGNILRFDTRAIPNGNYYYCLRTSNQKTMKKMIVAND